MKVKVNNLTEKIYKKYPKIWEKFKKTYNYKTITKKNNENKNEREKVSFVYKFYQGGLNLCVLIEKKEPLSSCHYYYNILTFDMLYVLLEKLFKKNNIIITLDFDCIKAEYWTFYIMNKKGEFLDEENKRCKTKKKTKEKAVLKVCKILENRLKNI